MRVSGASTLEGRRRGDAVALIKRWLRATGFSRRWLREGRDELRLFLVRLWTLPPFQRRKLRRLLGRENVLVNFGCGETVYEGWIGVDGYFASNIDVVLDLRQPLPFPNESVDLCYSEHFFEHLYPDEGLSHLREVRRVLRSGGVYRLVVPDVLKFAGRYLAGDHDFFARAFPWAERPMEALYCVANWDGAHRNILDYAELRCLGEQAGFAAIRKSEANGSETEALRIDKADPQRIEESLYVEFSKG